MDTILNYDLAMERIKTWQREAEIYRLTASQDNSKNRLGHILRNLRAKFTPKARRQTGPSL